MGILATSVHQTWMFVGRNRRPPAAIKRLAWQVQGFRAGTALTSCSDFDVCLVFLNRLRRENEPKVCELTSVGDKPAC